MKVLNMWNKNGLVGVLCSIASAAAVMCSTTAVMAQDSLQGIGIEAGASTLGIYLAPTYKFNGKLNGRAALYLGSVSATETIDGNAVTGKFSANSGALMADYLPFGNGLRLSGGLGIGGYEISGSTTNPTFNGTSYTGSVGVMLKQSDPVVPILAIGYAKTFKNGIGVLAEFGARIGTYTLTADDTNIPAGDQAQFAADVAKVNQDLKALPATPYLTFGISYRF